MPKYVTNTTELTSLASAIRTAAGISSSLIFNSGYISGISSIKGALSLADFIGSSHQAVSGTFNNNDITKVNSGAFAYCSSMTEVNLPNCETVGANAFYSCLSLLSINLPKCINISASAFGQCTRLSSINLPLASNIGEGAFATCVSLSQISLPACSYISANSVFYNCTTKLYVDLPACTSLGSDVFRYAYGLESVSLPVCSSIGDRTFTFCRKLSYLNLPKCEVIGGRAFCSCYNLLSLYLGGSSLCTLLSTSAFSSTPIGGYTTSTSGVYGSIFVPASLYDSYKSATNWVTYSDRFVSF